VRGQTLKSLINKIEVLSEELFTLLIAKLLRALLALYNLGGIPTGFELENIFLMTLDSS
jgi:hypothetical protein